MNYVDFLNDLDKRLKEYFDLHIEHIKCQIGCSACCENGDYPISELELKYIMEGYLNLDYEEKRIVQNNIKNIKKGGMCPFLIEKKCSIYKYRPIICRVHGLAYLCKDKTVKVPYCVTLGKNYAKVYNNDEITINPINENLDTIQLLKEQNFGEIRNLIDWLK